MTVGQGPGAHRGVVVADVVAKSHPMAVFSLPVMLASSATAHGGVGDAGGVVMSAHSASGVVVASGVT